MIIIKNDHDFLKTMQITLRNIVKLMGLVSKTELKNFKKIDRWIHFLSHYVNDPKSYYE
jgi:hypothetical protein